MTGGTTSLPAESAVATAPDGDGQFVGAVTRSVSWVVDALLINFAAIMAGLGTALVLSIFSLGKDAQAPLEAIAGALYVLWAAVYFIAFWSTTGQTPGARVMQIRLVAPHHRRVHPARAVVRWVGMNLAMLPLFAGYLPIIFGRRGFPDWLAKTLVIEAPQLSMAEARRAVLQARRDGAGRRSPAILPEAAPGAGVAGDGRGETPGSSAPTSPVI